MINISQLLTKYIKKIILVAVFVILSLPKGIYAQEMITLKRATELVLQNNLPALLLPWFQLHHH